MIRQTFTLLFIFTALLFSLGNAEEINDGLVAAKQEYEESLSSARKELLSQLTRKADAAEKSNKAEVARKLRVEMQALEKDQALPTSIPTKTYETQRRKALLKLEAAHRKAVKDFTKAGKSAEAKRSQAALDSLIRKEAARLTPLLGRELLRNPGAEDPWVAGVLPGWTAVQFAWGIRKADPAPADGISYFSPTPSPIAEIFQDVSLIPFNRLGPQTPLEVHFRCSVRSFLQLSPDATQVILEFRDGANRTVLESWDSGRTTSVNSWAELSETRIIPSKAKWIRVRLISTRSGGLDNDGYFDSVSLKVKVKGNNKLFNGLW